MWAGRAILGMEQGWGSGLEPAGGLCVPLYAINLILSSLLKLLCDLERVTTLPWAKVSLAKQ